MVEGEAVDVKSLENLKNPKPDETDGKMQIDEMKKRPREDSADEEDPEKTTKRPKNDDVKLNGSADKKRENVESEPESPSPSRDANSEDSTASKKDTPDKADKEDEESDDEPESPEKVKKSKSKEPEVVDGLEMSVECASDKEASSSDSGEEDEETKPRPKTIIVKGKPSDSEVEASASDDEEAEEDAKTEKQQKKKESKEKMKEELSEDGSDKEESDSESKKKQKKLPAKKAGAKSAGKKKAARGKKKQEESEDDKSDSEQPKSSDSADKKKGKDDSEASKSSESEGSDKEGSDDGKKKDKKSNQKRKITLSVQQRCDIIQRLNAGETPKSLGLKFKVSKQAISWIKKNQETILKTKDILLNCDGRMERKRYKGQEENPLDQQLLKWLSDRRKMGHSVTSAMIRKQALLYNKDLIGRENFTASSGWLSRFRKRYGLKNENIPVEKSSDLEETQVFKDKLCNLLKVTEMSLDCVYNCDETALYWKIMPNEISTDAEGKKSENRVTVMICTNASGTHKMPLLVIGKFVQPRCFINVKHLPVHYMHQDNSWMTCEIMKTWYTEVFIPEIRKKHDLDNNPNTRIILVMDNAVCHPPAEELNKLCESCTVMFLPPGVAPSVQPLCQGTIERFKRHYRYDLMKKVLLEGHKKAQDRNFLRSISILDACNSCELAWDAVTNSEIRYCWKNLIPSLNSDETAESPPIDSLDNEAFYAIMKRIEEFKSVSTHEVDHWLRIDDNDNGCQSLSDGGIFVDVYSVKLENVEDEMPYSEENWTPPHFMAEDDCPTAAEALRGLETLVQWYQRKGEDKDVMKALLKAQRELITYLVEN